MKTCWISFQLTLPAPSDPGRGSCEPQTQAVGCPCPVLEGSQGQLLCSALCSPSRVCQTLLGSPGLCAASLGCAKPCWDPWAAPADRAHTSSGGSEYLWLLPPQLLRGPAAFSLQGRYAASPAAPCPLQLQSNYPFFFLRNVNLATNSQQFH